MRRKIAKLYGQHNKQQIGFELILNQKVDPEPGSLTIRDLFTSEIRMV